MKAIVSVSDLHVGSTVGLCPKRVQTVDQGTYLPNIYQLDLLKYWRHFWTRFVPEECDGAEKVILEINGDVMDGVHHNTTNILSNSWEIQERAAAEMLEGIRELCPTKIDEIYMVRGTEAHVGPNGESEERIGRSIGTVKSAIGEHTSYQWWLLVDKVLFQFAHHISVTSSAAYESSAPMREMIAALTEAAQWEQNLPDVIVRSHRHRFIPVSIPSKRGRIQSVITPGWQMRTPHVERIDRMRMPHIGGIVFRVEGERCDIREKLYPLPGPRPTRI